MARTSASLGLEQKSQISFYQPLQEHIPLANVPTSCSIIGIPGKARREELQLGSSLRFIQQYAMGYNIPCLGTQTMETTSKTIDEYNKANKTREMIVVFPLTNS